MVSFTSGFGRKGIMSEVIKFDYEMVCINHVKEILSSSTLIPLAQDRNNVHLANTYYGIGDCIWAKVIGSNWYLPEIKSDKVKCNETV